MSTKTPATQMLEKAKVPFDVREYAYNPGHEGKALQAAEAIGADPERVLKTLMVEVDGKACCTVLAASHTLSMKRVAAAFGGKSAEMMDPAKAERLTGYHTGGISPFGQRKRAPTVFDAGVMAFDTVVINGGKRGMMVVLTPADAVKVTGGQALPLVAE